MVQTRTLRWLKIPGANSAVFIGSHTLIELIKASHSVVVVDNLSNANPESLRRMVSITGQGVPFYKVDIRDREGLSRVFALHNFDCCIHFAGLKAVGESVEKPWEYYENNIGGTLVLLDVMRKHGCKNIIFSSYPVHPRNKERVLRLVTEHSFRNIILIEPVGYFDSIHLINNAVTVVTDSGGVLQEAHYARTPYVFVLDIPKPPSDTRFDSSRLVRPKRYEILEKLRRSQQFDEKAKNEAVDLHKFENNLLVILKNFEKLLRTGL